MNSDISDHREAFFGLIAEAHGTPPKPANLSDTVLPSGHRWVPHQSKPGPVPRRRYAPASTFSDLFTA